MVKAFPNERPAFLFDDIERNTHTAISADAYRSLKADRDALQKRLDKGVESYKALRREKEAIEKDRDALKAKVDTLGVPGERAESTYQNIIASLLDCISGSIPGVERHPSFDSEAKLIETIDDYFRGYGGLSKSTLSRKFPDAKRALQSR